VHSPGLRGCFGAHAGPLFENPVEKKTTVGVDDAFWLSEALQLAEQAGRLGNVPVGAVIVVEGRVAGRGVNLRETCCDASAHAELIAIREAGRALESWRLEGATLYVTLEPCLMCAGAILQSRIARVVYGATEPKTGAHVSRHRVLDADTIAVEQHPGLAEACAELMTRFFEDVRERRNPR
jgi:tRNA(adenine34) deaminase